MEHSSKDEKVDEGIKKLFYTLHVFIFYLTKNNEKTELKEETEEVALDSFLTSIPTCAVNTAMYYDPFLVPLKMEDEEEEAED